MTVVYLDQVFLLNTLVDYLLLLTTAALAGTTLRRVRFAICGVFGGLYACAAFPLSLLAMPMLRVAAGAALAFIAFCRERRPWRLMALFLLLSAALAGAVMAMGLAIGSPTALVQRVYYADVSYGVLLGTAAVFYMLLHLVFKQGARYGGGDKVDIIVSLGGRRCRIRALRDSGNALRDPLYGRPVLVAEASALAPLWDEQVGKILRDECTAEEKMARLVGKGIHFTLLSYQSVGVSGGLLLAVRSEYLQIGKRIMPRVLIALTDTQIGSGCHALWSGNERGGTSLDRENTADTATLSAADRAG